MKIQQTNIDKIIPYSKNPRHNKASTHKIAASIKEFGWQQPIVVDTEMVIIAGHTRLEAAKQLGCAMVPVHIANSLTASQVKAYRLADNRLHEDSSWDEELLKIELEELQEKNVDLELAGFDELELRKILEEVKETTTRPGKELSLNEFENFTHECPKCGFGWN